MNYYDLLGININATYDEIRKSFLELSKKYHPDINNAKNANFLFTQLKDAYDTLSDPKLRHEYDQNMGFNMSNNSESTKNKHSSSTNTDTNNITSKPRSRLKPVYILISLAALFFIYPKIKNSGMTQQKKEAIQLVIENSGSNGPVQWVSTDPKVHTIYGWDSQQVSGNTYFVSYDFDYDGDKSNGNKMYCFEVELSSKIVRSISNNDTLTKKYQDLEFIQ